MLDWYAGPRRLSFKRRRAPAGYEQTATAAFDFVLEHAAVPAIYDIGAGSGYFGFLGAARRGCPVETHCFEMRPDHVENIERLAATHRLDGLHAHLSGMSDTFRGETEIWYSITKMFESEPGPSRYRDPLHWRLKFWLTGRTGRDRLRRARVTVDSVDAFTRRHGLVPGLVKIDVDGYEAKVLPGSIETFRRHRPVILLELHKSRFFAHHGVTRPGVVRPLFDLGYEGLFFTNHHDLARNRVIRVGPDSAELAREETDFLMFV